MLTALHLSVRQVRRAGLGSYACRLFVCCALLSLCSSARAQAPALDEENHSTETPQDTARQPHGRWALLPILFSSPDTGLALGLLPQYIFRTSPGSRPSSVRLDAYYTQKKQFHVLLTPSFWLHANTYRLAGKLSFKKWPTSFYGIGNDTSKEDAERFTEALVSASAEVQRQIRPGLFAGIHYGLRVSRISDTDPQGQLASGTIIGSDRGIASGIGVLVSWDTRDNVFYPSSGRHFQLSASTYGRFLGSDYDFSAFTLDLRQYLSPVSSHVLALQAVLRLTAGETPFRMLPGIGEVLRGYASARYIDDNLLALQVEYRIVPLWWRLGFVAFAGAGEVAHRITDFSLQRLKYAAGLGLRFQLDRREKVNVRLDYGVGQGSSGDYLDMPEAF